MSRQLLQDRPPRPRAVQARKPKVRAKAFEELLEICQAVQAEASELDNVLSLIVRKTLQLFEADLAWVSLLDPEAEMFRVVESLGATTENFNSMTVTMTDGLGGFALREKGTIVLEDSTEYASFTPDSVYRTMVGEGVVSVMCAPMLEGSTVVGALYAANRARTQFQPEHSALIAMVATQVSSAVRHAQMFQELETRNDLLERSFSVHRELTAISLREAGLANIAMALSRVSGMNIVVEQDIVFPYSQEYGSSGANGSARSEDMGSPQVVQIQAGGRILGQIVAFAESPSELQLMALDHGATVMALELLKQKAAREVEWRLRGELLEELLETSGEIPLTVAERAERLEVDLRKPYRILALESEGGSIGYGELLAIVRTKSGRRLHSEQGPVLAVKRGSSVMLAVSEVSAEIEQGILRDIREVLAARGSTLAAGISRLTDDFAAAHREATACMRLSKHTGDGEKELRSDDLGPLRFVLGSPDLSHASEMVAQKLGPLLQHDATSKSPLLPTLRAYLDADGHQPTVAAACYIHISTLKYRLKKIRSLIDGDLSQSETAFQLRLAFKLMDLLHALDVDVPFEEKHAVGK